MVVLERIEDFGMMDSGGEKKRVVIFRRRGREVRNFKRIVFWFFVVR